MASPSDHPLTVRARRVDVGAVRVYARNHAFEVGAQVSLRDSDAHPSAVEYLIGALSGDLLRGFETQAARHQIRVRDAEVNLTARLHNVLVHLGVVGEVGHPGLDTVTGTFYVSADGIDPLLEEIWRTTLARSPLYQTLSRCAVLSIRVEVAT